MTEASANGAEVPGNALQGASLATRFLQRHEPSRDSTGYTFIGFETPDPNDNATQNYRLYRPSRCKITKFQKYDYYKSLADTFDVGAKFRQSSSDTEGEMTWTYGPKPRITVAAARNPDETWGIGISNFTAPQFSEKPSDSGYENGFKAQTFDVTVQVPELKNALFTVHRNGPNQNENGKPLAMQNGTITIRNVSPLELVTLRSAKIGATTGVSRAANGAQTKPRKVEKSLGF